MMPFDAPQAIPTSRLRPALVADLFCGAGGSSTGADRALAAVGRKMELVCVNHWDRAIETHKLNHPTARHYCMDLESAKPAEIVPELRLDLLMASPTCTFHSRARGGKPVNDQQRMDPWHVVRWCTDLRVARLLVENVPEFVEWGPCDTRTGRPIKSRKGEYFRGWVAALQSIGFKTDYRIVNAADFGDATIRRRFFLIGRTDGKKLNWAQATHAQPSKAVMLGLLPWRAAREIIDWDLKGRSIFGRKKDLAPKTLARIYAGAVKFKWPEPFLVILRNHMDAQSIDGPVPAILANGLHIGLAEPVLVNMKGRSTASSIDQPTPAQTAHARHLAVAEPFIVGCGGRAAQSAPTGAADPIGTITAKNDRCLVEPFILNRHGENGSTRAHSIEAPTPSADCRGAGYLIEPFLLSQASGGAPRSTEYPTPSTPTAGATALIAPYYGSGSGETCQSAEQPLPTLTVKARCGLVVPVTHGEGGGPNVRSVDEPLATLTTAKGGEFAMVMPVTHGGGIDRAQNADAPLPTITGAHRGEIAIVAVEDHGHYDILFRMLEPKELAAAMGFSDDEAAYEFAGTKTEITKQIGNAVPVNTAAALVAALMRPA